MEYGRVGDVVRRSDSTLSAALLPDQPVPQPLGGEAVWRLRYADATVDPSWLSRISRELDTDIALLSGLVETVGGDQAGRLTVRIGAHLPTDKIVAVFAAYGIHARLASAADEADEADELAGVAS